MSEKWTNLPVDILKNIISYKLGEPEYLNIKHNHIKTLKRTQQRYKFNRTETKRKTKHCTVVGGDDFKRHIIKYYISRNIPLSIKSIEDIVFNENENLDCLLDDLETGEGYEVTLIVEVCLFVEDHQDDDSRTFTFFSHSDDVVDNVTIDNLSEVMMASYQEINSCIDEERSRTEFGGVKNIRFKLIVDEPV